MTRVLTVPRDQPSFLVWAAAGFADELVRLNTVEAPADESPGKRPVVPAWETIQVTADLVARWSRLPGNVGVRTRRFPAADVDVDDGPIAEACESVLSAVLGHTARRTRSNAARRALLYRLEGEPFKKRTLRFKLPSGVFAKVEFLADGQQLAVAGMHVSGVPNEWPAGQPNAAALAPVTLDRVDAAMMLLRAKLTALGCVFEQKTNGVEKHRRLGPFRSDWERDAEIAEEALSRIDPDIDHDEWIKIGMALHAKDSESGGRAFDLWDSWSSRGEKYPGRDALEKRWHSFKAGAIHFGTLVAMSGVSVSRHTNGVARQEAQAPTPSSQASGARNGDLEPPGEPEPTPPADMEEEPRASPEQLLGLAARPCNPARLRERQELRFVSLADLPERHGWGEFMDKLTGGGLAPGSIVGLGAAGTGAGKSAFLMQLLDGLAMRSSFVAENPEATEPLTPIMLLSEMDPEDLEARTLGRLLDAPGNVFLAGRSAKRWHKWSWVDSHYDNAAALMAPAGLYSRLARWQRVARPNIYGPALIECVEAAMRAWVAEIRGAHPGHEVVPIIAVDPINRFLATDGRSEVETLGELAALLDRLADARKWVGLIPADTNKNAARDPSQAPNAASVFRGTMQLLHACDLILVLEPGDSDSDGVRDYAVILDKNRYGRNGVGLNFRWHTRTGLRFVPETEEEWKARSGERPRPDDTEKRLALVQMIAELVAKGVRATRRSIQARAPELDLTRDALYALVDSAIVHGELVEEKAGRGGGMVLIPTGKGLDDAPLPGDAGTVPNCPGELSEGTVRNVPGQIGTVEQFEPTHGNNSETNCPGELSRGAPKMVTVCEPEDRDNDE